MTGIDCTCQTCGEQFRNLRNLLAHQGKEKHGHLMRRDRAELEKKKPVLKKRCSECGALGPTTTITITLHGLEDSVLQTFPLCSDCGNHKSSILKAHRSTSNKYLACFRNRIPKIEGRGAGEAQPRISKLVLEFQIH